METQHRTKSGIVWTLTGNIIKFDLVSNGMTGLEWLNFLPTLGYRVEDGAPEILTSGFIVPTPAGTIHHVCLIRGQAFSDRYRTTRNIIALGQGTMGWKQPHLEISMLTRWHFTDDKIKGMELEEIATMHLPINGCFLDIDRGELESAPAADGDLWHEGHGFMFEE